MRAFYNEIDRYCCDWLSNLMDAGHITPGKIDDRSITDISPDDLRGIERTHFFAGIGGWDYALNLAGWGTRPVWTGSCPCQPFSAAGKGKAADDERHLWPRWFPLIAELRPAIVFGEQVEAAIGWGWLDAVFADLEGEGYACGAAVLPACGVGAPHIRQRTWFVADLQIERWDARRPSKTRRRPTIKPPRHGDDRGLADANGRYASAEGLQRGRQDGQQPQDGRALRVGQPNGAGSLTRNATAAANGHWNPVIATSRNARELGDAAGDEQRQSRITEARDGRQSAAGGSGAWRALSWLPCTDGKARPVEPGTFPLAHGIPGRVGRLRAYGNAIIPQVAAEFVSAFMDCAP